MRITRIPHSTQPYYIATMQVRHLKRGVEMGSLLLAGLLMLRLALQLRHLHLRRRRHFERTVKIEWLIHPRWKFWKPREEYLGSRSYAPTTGPAIGHSQWLRAKAKEILLRTTQGGRTWGSSRYG